MPLSGYDPYMTTFYQGDGAVAFMQRLNVANVAAGWTLVTQSPWFKRIYANTYLPSDGHYTTIGSTTYTWKNTPTSPNHVLIGSTPADGLQNLMYAVNDESAYEGTKYGTGTSANTAVFAIERSGDYLYLIAKDETNSTAFTTGGNGPIYYPNTNWDYVGWGYVWKSGTTPDGNRTYVRARLTSDSNYFRFDMYRDCPCKDDDWTNVIHENSDDDTCPYTWGGYYSSGTVRCDIPDANVTYWGTPYAFLWYLPGYIGSTANYNCYSQIFVLKLSNLVPSLIITGAAGTPIQITTAVDHQWDTDDEVTIGWCEGNTAPNKKRSWTITKTGSDTFTLNGSVSNGTYTGGGRVGGPKADLNAVIDLEANGWREREQPSVNKQLYNAWGGENGYTTYLMRYSSESLFEDVKMYGAKSVVFPPYLSIEYNGAGTTRWYIGWVYDALLMSESQSIEGNEWTDEDGNVWFRWSHRFANNVTMWLLKEKGA